MVGCLAAKETSGAVAEKLALGAVAAKLKNITSNGSGLGLAELLGDRLALGLTDALGLKEALGDRLALPEPAAV